VRVRSFELDVPSGDVIHGDVRASSTSATASAIIVVHGFKGFKDWGFFPYVCERLAHDGHAVVSFNFTHNGIGDDPVAFTELERFAANTLSRELEEIHYVVDAIVAGDLLDARPRHLGVLGHSRGGGQAVLAAGEDARIRALATWAAVSDFDRWSDEVKETWRRGGRLRVTNARTGQEMPLDVALLDDFEANRDRLDIGAAAKRLSSPWLIVHGSADTTVAPDEARELARRTDVGTLLLIEGAGHTFDARHPFHVSTPELDRAIEATRDHFSRHLSD